MEKEIIRIKNVSEFINYYKKSTNDKKKNLGFGIYNSESEGKFLITKIEVDPKYCIGKMYRNRIDGWGIIYVDIAFKNFEHKIECRISVNSKKRAENWEHTIPHLGSPELWNWKKPKVSLGK